MSFTFNLPDGTQETVKLTASSKTPLPANCVRDRSRRAAGGAAGGGSPSITATNLKTALTDAVQKLSGSALAAASAIKAGDDFFNNTPPLRVAGTAPFGAATTQVAGTKANTVFWYNGEPDSTTDPARGTAVGRIDDAITVQYGIRADEQALRKQLQTVAVFAAVTTSATDPNGANKMAALNQRVAAESRDRAGAADRSRTSRPISPARRPRSRRPATARPRPRRWRRPCWTRSRASTTTRSRPRSWRCRPACRRPIRLTSQLYQMSLVKFL